MFLVKLHLDDVLEVPGGWIIIFSNHVDKYQGNIHRKKWRTIVKGLGRCRNIKMVYKKLVVEVDCKFGRGTTVRGVRGSITLKPLRSALSRVL